MADNGEQWVLKSRLPRLYWCARRGMLERIQGATIYDSYRAAEVAMAKFDDDYEAWRIVPLAEAEKEEV